MTTIDTGKLHGHYLTLYQSLRFQPNFALTEDGQRLHNRFNERLQKDILKLQELKIDVTKKALEERSVEILADLRKESQNSNFFAQKTVHEVCRYIDQAIKNGQATPFFTDQKRLQIIISIDTLTIPEDGVKWLEECLNAEYNESWHCVQICLVDLPIGTESSTSFVNQLQDAGIRKARQKFLEYAKENLNAYTGFKYSLKRRILDWITVNV